LYAVETVWKLKLWKRLMFSL